MHVAIAHADGVHDLKKLNLFVGYLDTFHTHIATTAYSVTELMDESGAIINDAVGLGDELIAIDKVPAVHPHPYVWGSRLMGNKIQSVWTEIQRQRIIFLKHLVLSAARAHLEGSVPYGSLSCPSLVALLLSAPLTFFSPSFLVCVGNDDRCKCGRCRLATCSNALLVLLVSHPIPQLNFPSLLSALILVHHTTERDAGTLVHMTFRNPRTDTSYSITVLRHLPRSRNPVMSPASPTPVGAVGDSAPPGRPDSVLCVCVEREIPWEAWGTRTSG